MRQRFSVLQSTLSPMTQNAVDHVLGGLCGDPRGVLGPLEAEARGEVAGDSKASRNGTCTVRVFLPPARSVAVVLASPEGSESVPMTRTDPEGIFEVAVPRERAAEYRLRVEWDSQTTTDLEDPYRFGPDRTAAEFTDFAAGEESRLADLLGAHADDRDGVRGTRFSVWAPRALAVNVMGSFNGWEARRSPMFPIPGAGVWELFMPGVGPGELYKFEIRSTPTPGQDVWAVEKADPMARRMEVRPRSASVVPGTDPFQWSDAAWLDGRADGASPGQPISIYEVHLGSWRRNADDSWLGYRALAETLLPYVKDLGFTHVELLPVTEHPYDASWGYQTLGYFALTSRYGEVDDFKGFVAEAHRLGIGVLLDWVPAHFPQDSHGLAAFDGSPLYELEDPKQATHPDWGTVVFDYGRPEVVSFLVSSARFWLDEYHVDGLRVDAVSSMLYLDYSREPGEWEPNELGGPENLQAAAFLRRLTSTIQKECPGTLIFAEESRTWPGVTAPVAEDGLGFDFKWSLGWMNDTLEVFEAAPHRRPSLHEQLTFSLHYTHDERHLLPLSHDEVVHLKRSLLSKMPGGYDDKFAGLRLLFGYMWTHPGAKLLFMGGEVGQWSEWSESDQVTWSLLEHPAHAGVQTWVRLLNQTYRATAALYALDDTPEGFEWLDVHDASRSVVSYLRWEHEWDDFVVVVGNFSSTARKRYELGVPSAGEYEILLDSQSAELGGKGGLRLRGPAEEMPYLDRPAKLTLDLPRLGFCLLRLRR